MLLAAVFLLSPPPPCLLPPLWCTVSSEPVGVYERLGSHWNCALLRTGKDRRVTHWFLYWWPFSAVLREEKEQRAEGSQGSSTVFPFSAVSFAQVALSELGARHRSLQVKWDQTTSVLSVQSPWFALCRLLRVMTSPPHPPVSGQPRSQVPASSRTKMGRHMSGPGPPGACHLLYQSSLFLFIVPLCPLSLLFFPDLQHTSWHWTEARVLHPSYRWFLIDVVLLLSSSPRATIWICSASSTRRMLPKTVANSYVLGYLNLN